MEGLLWLDQKEARMQCVPRKPMLTMRLLLLKRLMAVFLFQVFPEEILQLIKRNQAGTVVKVPRVLHRVRCIVLWVRQHGHMHLR